MVVIVTLINWLLWGIGGKWTAWVAFSAFPLVSILYAVCGAAYFQMTEGEWPNLRSNILYPLWVAIQCVMSTIAAMSFFADPHPEGIIYRHVMFVLCLVLSIMFWVLAQIDDGINKALKKKWDGQEKQEQEPAQRVIELKEQEQDFIELLHDCDVTPSLTMQGVEKNEKRITVIEQQQQDQQTEEQQTERREIYYSRQFIQNKLPLLWFQFFFVLSVFQSNGGSASSSLNVDASWTGMYSVGFSFLLQLIVGGCVPDFQFGSLIFRILTPLDGILIAAFVFTLFLFVVHIMWSQITCTELYESGKKYIIFWGPIFIVLLWSIAMPYGIIDLHYDEILKEITSLCWLKFGLWNGSLA